MMWMTQDTDFYIIIVFFIAIKTDTASQSDAKWSMISNYLNWFNTFYQIIWKNSVTPVANILRPLGSLHLILK